MRKESDKKALITGITGQDGSYLAELLLDKGYEVHGIVRKTAPEDRGRRTWRISRFIDRLKLHEASLDNYRSLESVVEKVKPDECYHLAAQSFVFHSFKEEHATLRTNIDGTLRVLSAIKTRAPECRFFFAGSSEMFGNAVQSPQNEDTPFQPRSVYGISKVAGYHLTRNYREAHGLFAVSGILFNHESPRRGPQFVTRKITSHAARIKLGLMEKIRLGNLDAKRDWGHAGEYVEAMWRMLQQEEPQDYVVATGKCHSVREFVELAFRSVGLDYQKHIEIDQKLVRPSEITPLVGDASKARRLLHWRPSITFCDLVREMVEADLLENSEPGRQCC